MLLSLRNSHGTRLLLRQWQARAVCAEEALTNQEHAEVAQVKLHGKLEAKTSIFDRSFWDGARVKTGRIQLPERIQKNTKKR